MQLVLPVVQLRLQQQMRTMDLITSAYDTVFYKRADPRVRDWLLMTSPWPLVSIIVVYLTLIKMILPSFMRNRRPIELKTVIKWYNIVQIVANAIVTWGIMTSGWTTTYHFGCMLPDYSMNPEALRMLRYMWWTIILKLMELLETVFFLLRKKQRQASFLHVYHHVSTLVIVWSATKYVGVYFYILIFIISTPASWTDDLVKQLNESNVSQIGVKILEEGLCLATGGITSFSPMINNAVHVIMYSYYLLSSEGSPIVKAFLIRYKKWLTIMQMIQFTLMIIYSSQVFLPSCPAPLGITIIYFPNVIFVYYMFYNFFKRNYINDRYNDCKVNGVKPKPT